VLIGLIILATATFFVPVRVMHPGWMVAFLMLTAVSFGLFGFVIGIWAETFEQLAIIPSLVVTPLTFLGGAFYSIDMLPQPWRTEFVQSGGLSRQRIPLELLRGGRCRGLGESRIRRGLHGVLPFVAVVDIPHGLPPEAVNWSEATPSVAGPRSGIWKAVRHQRGASADKMVISCACCIVRLRKCFAPTLVDPCHPAFT
jgi:hypothetical protein